MDQIITALSPYLPENFDLQGLLGMMAMVAVGSLLLGLVGRVCFGKRSALNHSVSSAIGILFIYAITIAVYAFNPMELSRFLAPLPFVTFEGDTLALFTFAGAAYPEICTQVLNLLILAFLVNVLDSFIPKGERVLSWYLYRLLTVALAMVLELLVTGLLAAFLPGVLVTYAPAILVGILALMLLLSVLKILLGLALTVVNPILGAIYGFFFSSLIGKMLGKAAVTTALLSALVFALEKLGYTTLCVAAAALPAYLPLILILLVLWYVLGHLL